MKIKHQILLAALVFFTLVTSCSSHNEKTNQATTPAANAALLHLSAQQKSSLGIQVGKLEQKSLGLSIFANGMIDVPPQNKSYISMPFGGYIKQIKVLDGMRVNKGQVLMSVEHPDIIQLQQDYLEINGQIEYLEADYQRQKQLFEKEAGSAKNFQQAKSAYLVAKAKRSGLEVKLAMAQVSLSQLKSGLIQREQLIRSPFDGVITKVTANVGAFAEPKDRLMEIIDLKHAHAELTVYEKYLAYLKKDQKVLLNFIDTDSEQAIEARIFLIGREISSERTVKVHCHFEKLPQIITPGSYLKAEIKAAEQLHWVVPNEAIVQYKGKDVVFIQQAGNFIPVDIDILLNQEEWVAIDGSNLNRLKSAQIVTSGAYELLAILNKEVE